VWRALVQYDDDDDDARQTDRRRPSRIIGVVRN